MRFLIAHLIVGFGIVQPILAQNSPPTAVQGAIARMEAVFSGRITCHHLVGSKSNLDALYYDLTFSGNSWKKAYTQDISEVRNSSPLQKGMLEIVTVSHKGRTIEYQLCPQQDGRDSKIADVKTGEIEMLGNQLPIFPQYAGTFWFARTLKYVKEHQAEAKYVRVDKVDGIDVVVYDWPVSKADKYSAFQSISHLLEEGGTLRAYIAPSLGYMLPKLEHLTTNGKVAKILSASEFEEYNTLYIPKKARIQLYSNAGPEFMVDYRLSNISDINEPIPESEFILTLPTGTQVADATSGTYSEFFLVSDDPNSIPDDLLNSIQTPKKSFIERWGWQGAVGLGILLGLVILGGLYMVRRLRSRRAAV